MYSVLNDASAKRPLLPYFPRKNESVTEMTAVYESKHENKTKQNHWAKIIRKANVQCRDRP